MRHKVQGELLGERRCDTTRAEVESLQDQIRVLGEAPNPNPNPNPDPKWMSSAFPQSRTPPLALACLLMPTAARRPSPTGAGPRLSATPNTWASREANLTLTLILTLTLTLTVSIALTLIHGRPKPHPVP